MATLLKNCSAPLTFDVLTNQFKDHGIHGVILQPIQDSEHPTLPVWCNESELYQLSITCTPMGLSSFLHIPGHLFTLVTITGSVQFSSLTHSCPTLCNPMDCSTPGLPVHHQLLELSQTHVHQVSDAIQPSHPLSSPSLPDFNLSQHQGLFE